MLEQVDILNISSVCVLVSVYYHQAGDDDDEDGEEEDHSVKPLSVPDVIPLLPLQDVLLQETIFKALGERNFFPIRLLQVLEGRQTSVAWTVPLRRLISRRHISPD